jgi:hypothetical protein
MRKLVEDAGEPLDAGWLSRFTRMTDLHSDTWSVGDRELTWELDDDRGLLIVTHPAAGGAEKPVRYRVRLVYTGLPSGGSRWWWSCPACRRRVGALYLPAGRRRLGCRRCCRLLYRSQYEPGQPRRRNRRPTVVVTRSRRRWTPATGWVVLACRTVRR